jgi:hypothetical protein
VRRNILLPLAALLVLIPSAVFFFQSADFADDMGTGETNPSPANHAPPVGDQREPPERREPKELTPAAATAGSAKTPGQLLEEALAAMPSMDAKARDAAVEALTAQLRAAGPAGLEAIKGFLATGRDLRFRDGYSFSGSKLSSAPTLRVALIEALREWPGSTAVLLEILRSKSSVWESTLVIRNLEKQNPGTYRHEAIQALQARITDSSSWDSTPAAEAIVFEVARHFRAEELLPQLHALTVAEPVFHSPDYVKMLNGFPDDVRSAAIKRLLAEPKVSEAVLGQPSLLHQFSFVDEGMRAFMVNAFARVWDTPRKLNSLQAFGATPPSGSTVIFDDPRDPGRARANAERDLKEARARKVLLLEIEPSADTPELQEAVQRARQAVTREIGLQEQDRRHEGDIAAEVEFGSGDGKATIKGRRIENIEIRSAPIIPKLEDADSTPEPGR